MVKQRMQSEMQIKVLFETHERPTGRYLVFSPTLLSLLLLLPYYYYYCHYCCYYYWLLLLLLFPQSSWLCVTGAWAGAGYGGRGS